jgi:16S rRNA (guanine966-N2)-methyltransferase
MRVISGELKGREIRTPAGHATRPTQGHVRQVLFDIIGEGVVGTRVLDLFAGSGALGIEALSRGALQACFVEHSPPALRCLRQNLDALDLTARGRVLAAHVNQGIRILEEARAPFDWIFADPPYSLEPEAWIGRAARSGPGGLLARGGGLVLEAARRSSAPEFVRALRRTRNHLVGETALVFYGWEERADESQGDLSGDV